MDIKQKLQYTRENNKLYSSLKLNHQIQKILTKQTRHTYEILEKKIA